MPRRTHKTTPGFSLKRFLCVFLIAIAAGFFALVTPPSAAEAKPRLTILSSDTNASLPMANPAFKHPKDTGQLFFLQRTLNANTVVYAARFDADGNLDSKKPVVVYWRRFADQGATMPLRWYERVFGFGVRVTSDTGAETRTLSFNALKSHKLELRQTGPFTAALFTRQNNRDYRLIYAYLDVDESGLFPKVTGLRLYTSDPATGQYVTHSIAVSGGAYKE